jgi:hypothetical protein
MVSGPLRKADPTRKKWRWKKCRGNVPKRERAKERTKAQYVVVEGRQDHQWQKKWHSPVRQDRRKTGVNTDDFGCLRLKKIKNNLDRK